jgi:hypothetical protein
MVFWSISQPYGKFSGHPVFYCRLVHFFPFWYVVQKESGKLVSRPVCCIRKYLRSEKPVLQLCKKIILARLPDGLFKDQKSQFGYILECLWNGKC